VYFYGEQSIVSTAPLPPPLLLLPATTTAATTTAATISVALEEGVIIFDNYFAVCATDLSCYQRLFALYFVIP
jgi:hypothetical protein